MDQSTPDQTHESHAMRALSTIGQVAHERCGHHPGFDSVLCFIEYPELVQAVDEYPGTLFATGEEHRALIATFLQDESNREKLIWTVLEAAPRGEGSNGLLARIRARMIDSLPRDPVRPQFYAGPTEQGLAVALAIYDAFWTDEW